MNVTLLTSGASATDTTSYTTASISPAPNSLVLAVIGGRAAASQTVPTASGGGLTTLTEAQSHANDTSRVISCFRALQASPGSGAVTFDFGAIVQTWAIWSIFQIDGIDLSGSNGSGAIVQTTTAHTTGPETSMTATLAAFGSALNMAVGGFFCTDPGVPDTNFLVGSGFTKIHSLRETVDSDAGLLTEYKAGEDLTVDCTFQISDGLGFALEIKAAVGGGAATPDADYMLILPSRH